MRLILLALANILVLLALLLGTSAPWWLVALAAFSVVAVALVYWRRFIGDAGHRG